MKQDVFSKIQERKVVAICRGIAVEDIVPAVEAVYKGGISVFEVTFDQTSETMWQETAKSIKLLKNSGPSDIVVGAGTVMKMEQLELAIEAGAEFILAPNVNIEIIKEAHKRGVLMVPGAYTPTEAADAYDNGADIIKMFPAGLLGTDYIKAVRGPMNHIPFMAVGNINHNNYKEYLNAGCMSVGVGSNVMNLELIKNKKYQELTELAKKYS